MNFFDFEFINNYDYFPVDKDKRDIANYSSLNLYNIFKGEIYDN